MTAFRTMYGILNFVLSAIQATITVQIALKIYGGAHYGY
jgi:hypothetical protein